MRMPVGTRIVFGNEELVALVSSGILEVTIGDVPLQRDQAFICRHIEPKAAEFITVKSSSGYEMKCLSLADEEWALAVVVEAPEFEDDEEE